MLIEFTVLKKRAVGLLFFAILYTAVARADILSASIDYHNGDYQKAYQAFNQLAQLGNKDAIYNIAVMYLHGQGREQDLNQAYAWFRLAAEFGLADASNAAKLIKAKSDAPAALNAAYQQLQIRLNVAYFNQTLAPQFILVNSADVYPKPQLYAEPKYPQAALNQGLEGWVWLEYEVGANGVVTDIDIIEYYPDKSFNRSVRNALRRWRFEADETAKTRIYSLVQHFTTFKGKRYQQSFSRQQRQYQQQVNELIERAEQGNAAVQYHIANFMMGYEHNATRLLRYHWSQDKAGNELLLEAATNGHANAQYRLGSDLIEGLNTKQETQKGLNWVTKAAEQGFVHAQYRLGKQLLSTEQAQGLLWLTKAAEQQHFRAMRDLAIFYLQHQDWQQAQQWADKALKIDDEHPSLWMVKSEVLAALKDFENAAKAEQKANEFAKDRDWIVSLLE